MNTAAGTPQDAPEPSPPPPLIFEVLAGYPLNDEGLSCEATASDSLDRVSVQCTGTTEAGEQAELTGETAEFPAESIVEVAGTFTATVDDAEVFSTDVLGGCATDITEVRQLRLRSRSRPC